MITNNDRGIDITNDGSADIDGNVITGNDRGISISTTASVALSTDTNHYDTNPGLLSLENNLIEGNDIGFRCRFGASASGNSQNFGAGNTTSNVNYFDCHLNSAVTTP